MNDKQNSLYFEYYTAAFSCLLVSMSSLLCVYRLRDFLTAIYGTIDDKSIQYILLRLVVSMIILFKNDKDIELYVGSGCWLYVRVNHHMVAASYLAVTSVRHEKIQSLHTIVHVVND